MSLFVKKNGKIFGPFPYEDVIENIGQGFFSEHDFIADDRITWITLKEYLEQQNEEDAEIIEEEPEKKNVPAPAPAPVLKKVGNASQISLAMPTISVQGQQSMVPNTSVMQQVRSPMSGMTPQGVPFQMKYPPKKRINYILYGLLLGGLGIHNFYAGYTEKAVTQLVLSLLLGWTIVVPVCIGIWVIIEVCFVDKDANGIPFM